MWVCRQEESNGKVFNAEMRIPFTSHTHSQGKSFRSATIMENTSCILLCILIPYMCRLSSCVITVGLDETVNFPCNQTCLGKRKWTLNDDLVVECDKDHCVFGTGFKNGVKLSNDSIYGTYPLNLTISKTEFTDQGAFTGSCDDYKYCHQNLEVLVPWTVTAPPGDNATLPCYAVTQGENQNAYVLWERNGTKILQLENGNFSYGSLPEERVSVSKDGLKKGDLSLHLTDVQPSDQGLYHCQYSNRRETEKFKGGPNSVKLIVQVPQTVTASPGDNATLPGETQSHSLIMVVAIIILVVCLIVCLTAAVIWKKCKSPPRVQEISSSSGVDATGSASPSHASIPPDVSESTALMETGTGTVAK